MSEKLTAEQIQHISRLAEAARFSGSMKVGTYELTALCDLALSAADAEQRGRAAGLAYAVKLLTAIKDPEPDKDDSWNMGFEVAVDQAIRALFPSPDHVLVPREEYEKLLFAAGRTDKDPALTKMAGGAVSALEAATSPPRKFDPTAQ